MRVVAAIVGMIFVAASAAADQRDPRLDILFDALIDAGIESSRRVESEIWTIWLEHEDPATFGLMQIGVIAMSAGDMETALSAFDVLVDRAPDYAEAWNKRATVLFMMGEHQQSLADVAKTLELEPRHFGALSGAGLILDAMDQPESALKAYREALAVNPNLPHALVRVRAIEEELAGAPL